MAASRLRTVEPLVKVTQSGGLGEECAGLCGETFGDDRAVDRDRVHSGAGLAQRFAHRVARCLGLRQQHAFACKVLFRQGLGKRLAGEIGRHEVHLQAVLTG